MKNSIKQYLISFCFIICAVNLFAATKYISPNSDGIQDELVIPLHISDKRYIKSWSLIITDSNKKVVRVISNKNPLPENMNVKTFFKQLVAPKGGVEIPDSIIWNGAMNNGETAPDGKYFYYVTAVDDNDNVGKTKEYEVIVDTSVPFVEVKQPTDKTFGEGSKSALKIEQSGSKEDEWTGVFKNSEGKIVKTVKWTSSEPAVFSWYGTNDNGEQVPDGIYSYEITSVDKAGNTSARAGVQNIIYSADKPATNIYVMGSRFFSPETNSNNSNISFSVTIPVPEQKTGNKLVEWSVVVSQAGKNGNVVKVYNQESDGPVPPDTIVFDGKDSNGKLLPDGEYQASVNAKYLNGYVPTKISSPVFVLDTKNPDVFVKAETKVFGGKNIPEAKFNITALDNSGSPRSSWIAQIKSVDDDKVIRTFNLSDLQSQTVVWDGINDEGKIAGKGEYVLSVVVTDDAGNIGGGISQEKVTFDTTEASLLLAMKNKAFSPNNDNVLDTILITPVTETKDVTNYTFCIYNSLGKVIYSKNESKKLPMNFIWDGKDNEGIRVDDGTYKATLAITTANGSEASSVTGDFVIDTQYPSCEASIPYSYFSPDSDGIQDNLPISILNCTSEQKWICEIRNNKDKIVKSIVWNGTTNKITWDGTNESGNICDNGTYNILIHSTDEAGNNFSTEIKNVVMDNRETKIYLTAEYDGISPNNDKVLDSQVFKIKATVAEDLDSWKFNIKKEDGSVVYSVSNIEEKNLPSTITWYGNDKNKNVCEGTFFATLDVQYKKGNKVNAVSTPFVCTVTPPKASVQTAPQYFSPDNDGVDDDLFIKLSASTKAQIKNWSFVILDPKGKKFWTTEGKEQVTERIIWDGLSNIYKDSNGNAERVQSAMDYPYKFTISDNLGMTTVIEGVIPIDVLVIRDGNVLKMAVPSIIFESDASNFQIANNKISQSQVKKNLEILNRIADILKKFPDYKISIQGHANRVSDNQAEETEDNLEEWGRGLMPLSKERADGIKDYLVKKGVPSSNITTEGLGGTKPVVNPKDKDNNWKNRRVEFILVK